MKHHRKSWKIIGGGIWFYRKSNRKTCKTIEKHGKTIENRGKVIINHEKIIDVGSGTGDIAKNILKTNFKGELHLLDLNIEMLNIGKRTINKNKKIFFHQSNAEKTNFEKNYFGLFLIIRILNLV